MVHTVGLMGANGLVGAPTTRLLAQSAKEGKIKLVVLHRTGSAPKDLDTHQNIEMRVLNLDDPAEEIEKAVRGINVFISTIGFAALPSEPNVVDALAKSPDLVTFIPSVFSAPWTKEDTADPYLGAVVNFLHVGWDRAKEKGLGVTAVYTGIFDNYFFEYGFVGCALKQNLVWANQKQLQNRVPITAISHLSEGLAHLATSDPQSIKNTEHSFVTLWPTGQEVAELYTKINGKPTEIKDFTEKDRQEFRADVANFGAAKVGYWDHWESGLWDYENDGRVYERNYKGPGLEEVARSFA